MNYVSLQANICEYKYEMVLKTPTDIFHCKTNPIEKNYLIFEISDEDLIKLRDFLDSTFPKIEPILNENS